MAYGIEMETANGNIQVSSGSTNSGLIVIESVASSYTVSFDPAKELVFAKPASTSYTTQNLGLSQQSGTGTQTYTFKDAAYSSTSVLANYIKAKWANEQTAGSSGYGVQVWNADGELGFDSSLYTGDGGFGIISMHGQQTLNGYGTSSVGSRMTTAPTYYVNMNGTFAFGSGTFIGYTFSRAVSNPGIFWNSFIYIGALGIGTITLPNFTPRFLGEGGSV